MNFKENLLQAMNEDIANKVIEAIVDDSTHAVLLNTNFISDEEFLNLFPHVKRHPYVQHAFIYNKNEYELGKSIYHELGYFYIQDPSAMVVSSLIDFGENDLVLDLAAAPGGKSIQASLKMNGNGLIISNDLSYQRAQIITSNTERLGLKNLLITSNDFSKIFNNYLSTFDKIILDAPCSGSGMFRKDPQMIKEWSINKVIKYAALQKELISIAYKMLKPGGLLSYSTCSYSIEEDEEVIDYLLSISDAELLPINSLGYINSTNPKGVRLMPPLFEGEGQYICHIRKPGISNSSQYTNENNFKKILPPSINNYHIIKINDFYFAIQNHYKNKDLLILREGVKIGEYVKNIFKYDIHLARSNISNDFPKIELSFEDLKRYLSGEQLTIINPNHGHVIVTYKNNPVDITKTDGKVIKNHYPKGLRRRY